jgi:phosphate-selective porin OprO/OprP
MRAVRAIVTGCAIGLLLASAPPAHAQGTGELLASRTPPIASWSVPVSSNAISPAADQTTSASGEKPESIYDRIWKFTDWYHNESNPAVQRVVFTGRFQHEYAAIDADQGDLAEWNVRRMRLGWRATLFRTLTAHGEVELNPQEADPFYVRLTDLYVQWSRNSQLVVTTGKQSVPFTMDGATSSKELLTIDRSNLSNNICFSRWACSATTSRRRSE